ncbi:NEDD4-binding protein 1 [Hermetia illucens]|uniref:NEDD4-binding protein 1 n=1 Tax=Hermetia illucens TaxID=343691 RepID=UPI0018CBF28E|nr:NEDD4-binding protein 1 [Hermetia illucens]
MRPRTKPGRVKKRPMTKSRNILSRVKRNRRPQNKIIRTSKTRRKPRPGRNPCASPSSTSSDIQPNLPVHSPNLEQSQQTRRPGTLFERITQPFKKFRDTLRFPYYLRSMSSTPSTDIIFDSLPAITSSDRKRTSFYTSNTYNPNKEKRSPGKRMVIIDGSNVAYAHSCNKFFSVKGIDIALQYFERIGHEAKAVVPQHRLRKFAASDPQLLAALHRQGKIVLTPCKNLPGKSTASYDDRFILQLAVEFDAAVVSNDNFNDLINESPAFKKVIESRVIGYTWCKDMFMLPKDPYGRSGPNLATILNRS